MGRVIFSTDAQRRSEPRDCHHRAGDAPGRSRDTMSVLSRTPPHRPATTTEPASAPWTQTRTCSPAFGDDDAPVVLTSTVSSSDVT